MWQKTDKPNRPTSPNLGQQQAVVTPEQKQKHWQLTRRTFCHLAMGAVAVLSTSLLQACEPEKVIPSGPQPPTLPKCKVPTTAEEKTIEAFCEVIIPGLRNDPEKIPGAVETCIHELFFDPELPAAPLVPLIVLVLDSNARSIAKKPFIELTYEQQIEAVTRSEKTLPDFGFAIQLVRLGYYSSEITAYYMSYPGPNTGYINHPDFSFRKEMSKELTKDGNVN